MPAWVSSPVHRSVIASLVAARTAAGLTQRDLASKLRKPPSFVGKVESIERNLSVLEFLAWAAALGIEPSDALPALKDVIDI
ncbi:helix-turn-helix domain-containing protein [Brevundimonas sp.]|uniref:helix-turn-helix domain-containing protein n=1 Tax=Brevundimonas sp. TaxID=1871086 RepID=UPI00356146D8